MIHTFTSIDRLRSFGLAAFVLMLSACGGGGGNHNSSGSSGSGGTTPVTLQSIAVSPSPLATGVGVSRQLTAIATYSDGSTATLGTNATWSSQSPSIATVANGLVAGVADGSAQITVESSGVSANVMVNVTTNTWTPVANMLDTESTHTTLTTLENGKVLAVGGSGTDADSEIYDSVANTWTDEGYGIERIGPTATLLTSGKVLVAGGANHLVTEPSSVVFDPTTNMYSSAANMLSGRQADTATLLPDGMVLVAGGATFPLAPAPTEELYDPATNVWSPASAMNVQRTGHTATLLPNGKVLVTGGYGGAASTAVFSSAEIYDPAANAWTIVASMSVARLGHTATLLPDGRVLIAGGESTIATTSPLSSAEIYDPVANTWTPAASLSTAREQLGAVLLPSGKVLVFGGQNASGALTSAELYDPSTDTWSSAGNMSYPRLGSYSAALAQNNAVLVCGGGPYCDLYW